MGIPAESQEKLAFVIASAVESKLIRLIDRANLELFALKMQKLNEEKNRYMVSRYSRGFLQATYYKTAFYHLLREQ